MEKPAAEVMHDAIVAAVIDGITALRAASKGLPNALLRDINAIHPNTTFDDLPADLRHAIAASVRATFMRLQKEGYAVVNPKVAAPQPRPQSSGSPPPNRGAPGARPRPRPGPGKRPPRR